MLNIIPINLKLQHALPYPTAVVSWWIIWSLQCTSYKVMLMCQKLSSFVLFSLLFDKPNYFLCTSRNGYLCFVFCCEAKFKRMDFLVTKWCYLNFIASWLCDDRVKFWTLVLDENKCDDRVKFWTLVSDENKSGVWGQQILH